jgi:hypothetical protein
VTETVRDELVLEIDPKRLNADPPFVLTNIFVRARLRVEFKLLKEDDEWMWGSFDATLLTRESLLRWLKSRGGDNEFAEDAVGVLLGHGRLHRKEGRR